MSSPDALVRRRWRACLQITGVLMAIGCGVTFGIAYFARQLNFSVLGWPLSFWVASQGALVMYLALVCLYAWAMRRLDDRFGADEGV